MSKVSDISTLEKIYGNAGKASLVKVANHITPKYGKWVEAARFCILSTVGERGVDASPRGDVEPVVRVKDNKTLIMPDWKGNNRMDSLRNIIDDGRASLMLMTGGANVVTRINGHAEISIDEDLIQKFIGSATQPRSVIIFHVKEIYFQCARALKRAELWETQTWPELASLPTAGEILQEMSNAEIDGSEYDHSWPDKAKHTMW